MDMQKLKFTYAFFMEHRKPKEERELHPEVILTKTDRM